MSYSNENGTIMWKDGGGVSHVIGDLSNTGLAVLYDAENGVLHKHGRQEKVAEEYKKVVRKLRQADWGEFADNLALISFPATEETLRILNATIHCSGSVLSLPKRLAMLKAETILSAKVPK